MKLTRTRRESNGLRIVSRDDFTKSYETKTEILLTWAWSTCWPSL